MTSLTKAGGQNQLNLGHWISGGLNQSDTLLEMPVWCGIRVFAIAKRSGLSVLFGSVGMS